MKAHFEHLYAPWRQQLFEREKPKGCLFCSLPAEKNDKATYILSRHDYCFTILNRFPYSPGHLMVIPFDHTADFANLKTAAANEMTALAQKSTGILKEAFSCEGVNVGMNLGVSAGAGIPGHLHLHIVPRWLGDTNFIPVIDGSRVVTELLDQTYEKLKPYFG